MTQVLLQNTSSRYSDFRILSEAKFHTYQVYDTHTNQDVVLKIFPANKNIAPKYENEKSHLLSLNHPNIVKLIQSIENALLPISTKNELSNYLVLEHAFYGDLTDIVGKHGKMNEKLAKVLFHQTIDAVAYLHSQNIAHLDLKPENLLLDEDYQIKVADFDLSQSLDSKSLENFGTQGYRAPEILNGTCKDFIAADLYSIGVILFVLVTGCPPFNEISSHNGKRKLCNLRKMFLTKEEQFWNYHCGYVNDWDIYSEELKELLKVLLAENPEERTIENIKKSTWFQNEIISDKEYIKEMGKYLGQ